MHDEFSYKLLNLDPSDKKNYNLIELLLKLGADPYKSFLRTDGPVILIPVYAYIIAVENKASDVLLLYQKYWPMEIREGYPYGL